MDGQRAAALVSVAAGVLVGSAAAVALMSRWHFLVKQQPAASTAHQQSTAAEVGAQAQARAARWRRNIRSLYMMIIIMVLKNSGAAMAASR